MTAPPGASAGAQRLTASWLPVQVMYKQRMRLKVARPVCNAATTAAAAAAATAAGQQQAPVETFAVKARRASLMQVRGRSYT
jgi:hypothetical protein